MACKTASIIPLTSIDHFANMHPSDQLIIVMTTVASHEDAERITNQLLEAGLAACIQIDGPMTSHYLWKGTIERSNEFRLTIKTANTRWQTLKEQLVKHHPYEEPEILMLPVMDTTESYFKWVVQHTR